MSFFSGFVGLGTGTTSFVEQTGAGYARQAVTLNQSLTGLNRHITNAAAATFTASAAWTNPSTQVGVFAYATGGSPVLWWRKTEPIAALANGATATLGAASLNLFINDIAAAAGQTSNWQAGDQFGVTAGNTLITVGAPLVVVDGAMAAGFPPGCVAKLVGANLNSTADQQMVLNPALQGSSFLVTKIVATNASVSPTTAVGGVYPAVSKGGTPLVAATQAYSALTTSALYTSLTLAAVTNTTLYSAAPYFALTTPQGVAATVDLYLVGQEIY